MPTTSKPKPPKPRTISLVRPPTIDGVGVFRVTVGDVDTIYTLHEIPSEMGGRGFAVHRLGLGEVYHVRVDEGVEKSSCECKGFLRYGYCRHVLGLLALVKAGQI